MDNLVKIRSEIDKIDQEMALLYEKRMLLMREVADYKKSHQKPVLNLNREEEVIKKNSSYINSNQLIPYYEDFIQFIMDQGKKLQINYLKQIK